MMDTGISMNNTTSILKNPQVSSIPTIREIQSSDLNKYVYTGLTVTIPTPLVKVSSIALFGVNIDGFIPPYNLGLSKHSATALHSYPFYLQNFMPIIATKEGLKSKITLNFEQIELPPIVNYLSHRFVSGNVGIGIRISSNTAQTGNILVTQTSGAARHYFDPTDPLNINYDGLNFTNEALKGVDVASDAFSVIDLSLNRNLAITPIRRDPTTVTDFAQKLYVIPQIGGTANDNSFLKSLVRTNQFLEDWLLFSMLTDFPGGSSANNIVLSFFFDYSRVNFYVEMLPMIPHNPLAYNKDIIKVVDTLHQASFVDKTKIVWTDITDSSLVSGDTITTSEPAFLKSTNYFEFEEKESYAGKLHINAYYSGTPHSNVLELKFVGESIAGTYHLPLGKSTHSHITLHLVGGKYKLSGKLSFGTSNDITVSGTYEY